MKKKLHLQKSLFALLLALFVGMGTAYAADFSAVCSTGQTLYYNITDATNHYVEITFPVAVWEDDPWEGYTKPTGNITLPSSVSYNGTTYAVKAIGRAAFYNCSGLTGSLTIPNSVTSIGPYAFYYCSGLTGSLTIPNSVTTIETNAFSGSSGFTGSLTIPNSVTTIDSWAFYECSGFTGSLTIGNSVSSIGYGAFWACEGFTGSLTIPNSVTTIGDYAFFNCSGFTGSLTIGNSVTTIGNHAFRNCSGFTGSLTLGNSVTSIGPYAFYYCSGLTGSLTIPNSLTTINPQAFMRCSGLTSLTLPASVSSIGFLAFSGCEGLTTMTVFSPTPPSLGDNVFNNVPTDISVYVPCESWEDYQAASGWSDFTNMQCLETLTVYDGTDYNNRIPANIYYFDYFNRSQFVVPAADLMNMRGRPIRSMTFYTASINVPYTTVSNADVYLMEVDYTTISDYEPQASATVVYSGLFSIVSANGGGEMTINFSTPYVYQGGNLLVGIDNTEANGYKEIYFKGQTVNGASIWGANVSSTGTIPASQQDFIPKTSFVYAPSMCAPKTLPYTYGFEEEDEFDCWTMLDCDPYTGRSNASYSIHQGDYGFRFCYNTNPPQYLISPELKGTTGVDVSFYYKNYSNDYPETFQVGYSTTTQSLTAFTWGDEVTAQDKDNWMLYEESFPEGAKYIAVKYNSYDQTALLLDDFSFTPVFCPTEDQCELTFTLTDSYGDGWNGAAINVVNAETGIVLATMTNVTYDHANAPITEAYTLAVCDGRELRFEWVSGSYDSECSYVVTAANGTEIFSGSGAMSTPVIYTVNCSSGQTIALSAGTNWFSTNVEITLDDLKAALVAASSGNSITIKSQNSGQTTWNGRLWVGTLRTMDVSQMYMISVANACEITLEGLPINPAEHPVTISNGPNWIGFPLGATMTITNAFAGFAASGDIVKSDGGGQATWNGRIWTGQLKNLEPGKGYVYESAAAGSRTFTFPTGTK